MTDFLTMPDLEAVASFALRSAAFRAYSSIPRSPEWPLATVAAIGGPPAVRRYLAAPLIEIQVWGGAPGDPDPIVSKGETQDTAQEMRLVLHRMEGSMFFEPVEAWVSGVDDVQGLTWAPDPDEGRARYIFSVRVFGRSLTPAETAS